MREVRLIQGCSVSVNPGGGVERTTCGVYIIMIAMLPHIESKVVSVLRKGRMMVKNPYHWVISCVIFMITKSAAHALLSKVHTLRPKREPVPWGGFKLNTDTNIVGGPSV